MDGDAQGFVDGLKECFADLEDPRIEKSCHHRLFDILATAVLSVACGADDWCDKATLAKVRLDWLKTFLELPGGAPSQNASTNLGAIRRLIVSLLRQETTLKRGAKAKRLVCALDTSYLLKVFATAEIDS